jgi:hypothetical protein
MVAARSHREVSEVLFRWSVLLLKAMRSHGRLQAGRWVWGWRGEAGMLERCERSEM